MCTQQVSFPDSPVRCWFILWEPSPQWHQLPPRHQPSLWHHTKTFLAQREGEHHARHIYGRDLCSAPLFSYTILLLLLLFLNLCLYSCRLCLTDHQRVSLTSVALVPWFWSYLLLCFSFIVSLFLLLALPLMATAIHQVHLKSFFPGLLFQYFFLPLPLSVSLLVKWSHDSKGKMPSEEVTTHWALSNSLPQQTEGLCVRESYTEREKQTGQNGLGSGEPQCKDI